MTNPVTYIEQLSYLIYLKHSTKRKPTASYRHGSSARMAMPMANYCFQTRLSASAVEVALSEWYGTAELRPDEVFPYMASLVKEEAQIAEYFRDAVLEIVDPNVLKAGRG